ncbi:MAG: DUF2975 domain-containing protein [Hyphomonadaceae bacterium]|nr:DUF2975 domain-containing protein [Hyphomonadaceae bacterium]
MKALGKGSVASVVEVVLRIASWVLWASLGGLAVVAIAYAVIYIMIGAGWVDASTLAGGGFRISIFGVDSDAIGDVRWADWHVVVPSLLVVGILVGGALIVVSRLRLLFDSFTSGEPFRRENATHLRVIWITMLAMEIGRYVLMAGAAAMLAAVGPAESADITISIDFSNWLSIAVLFVLAEVFREGARLKEEQELTI